MTDFPGIRFPPAVVITPWSIESCGSELAALCIANASGGMFAAASGVPGSNKTYWFPFRIYETSTAVKMSYIVGSTSNGNIDVGIYDSQGNLLVHSGSVAQGTASTLQEIDITDTILQPGLYYMAIQFSSASGTWFVRAPANDEFALPSLSLYAAILGGFGLPSTFVPSSNFNAGDATPPIGLLGVHFDTLV